jgi:drug/metabolite transporter (DMT)-like permease
MYLFRLAVLVLGVYACSTAVIMIKMSELHFAQLSAYRLLVAAVLLTPLWIRGRLAHGGRDAGAVLGKTVLPGILLGIHFITWVVGARITLAANASLIVNMVPVAMPFLTYLLSREVINRGEVFGTLLAMAGVFFLGAADLHISLKTFAGDVICLVSMFFFAGYLALGRDSRKVADIWLFVVPLYWVAGLFCLAVSLCRVSPIQAYSMREVLLILGLGIIPTVVGHSSLLYCMRHLRPQLVAIGTLGQFVFAGIMAYFFFAEVPGWTFYLASTLLVTGAIVAIRSTPA